MSDVKSVDSDYSDRSSAPSPVVARPESVRQVIKIQNSVENRRSRGSFFTLAHLYLKPASFVRENSKMEDVQPDVDKK